MSDHLVAHCICTNWYDPETDEHRMQHEDDIPPAQAVLGVLSQEEIDAVVCLRAGEPDE